MIMPENVIIPSYYADLAASVKHHYHDYAALERSIEIGQDLKVDNDALDELGVKRDQEYEIAQAMAKVLDARCPNCELPITKMPKGLSASELVDGHCSKCGAPIIIEGA